MGRPVEVNEVTLDSAAPILEYDFDGWAEMADTTTTVVAEDRHGMRQAHLPSRDRSPGSPVPQGNDRAVTRAAIGRTTISPHSWNFAPGRAEEELFIGNAWRLSP